MPKYTKKPVEVEAFKLGFEKIPQWFKDHMKCLVWLFSYKGPYTDVIEKRGSMNRVVKAYEGDYIVKYENGDVKVMSPVVFEQEFEKVHDTAAKKARKMAELSGILTKNGFDFTEKESEIDNNEMARGKLESLKRAFEEGRIKSSSVTNFPIKDNYGQWQYGEAEYTFRVEPSAIAKEFVREVLFEKPVTMSLDGEEVGKACFKEVSKVMKRQDMRSK
ncbi:hypothetical protein CHH98_10390 [Bacillus licheniformis]|uniref:hypothetical protein n=1 Tax=Bacillus licheniformis TaxID=1402 RepID=UPI000BA7C1A2|nr:hypothetical protein [Bacillus licheniformis]PAD51134.1 hypothetical protein CHH98_10390 [Bacillus licheniformis]